MKLILVRHGETVLNAKNVAQGWMDDSLNENGRRQAEQVSARLKDLKISAIYSSDLKRARETAEAIAKPHRLKVVLLKSLREQNYGRIEGVKRDEINKRFDNYLDKRKTDPDLAPPGGETFRQVMKRFKKTLDDIYQKHREGTVVVVTHGGGKKAALWALGVMGFEELWNHSYGNTSVTELELEDGKAKLICFNCTKHVV